jgi:hypothetical protein
MDELYRLVTTQLRDGDLLLLKASRGLALELLADRLVEAGFAQESDNASELLLPLVKYFSPSIFSVT